MKATESTLVDFITDHNLELPGIGICFKATIQFITQFFFKEFICEVHIITMLQNKQSIVYLIHDELSDTGIPDVFPFHPDHFQYDKAKGLVIHDYDLLRGKYNLIIMPLPLVKQIQSPIFCS